MLDIKLLQNFLRIAETGSLTRAANIVGVTQAALSRQMAQLESELQTDLLIRSGSRGVTLTDSGKLLLEHAQVIVGQVQRAQRAVRGGGASMQGHIALGLPPSLSRTMAVPLVEAIRVKLPGSTMTTVEGLSSALMDLLENGRLDCAVVYNRSPTQQVDLTPLSQEDLYFVSGSLGGQMRSKYGASIPLEAIADYPVICAGKHDAVHTSLVSALAERGKAVTVAHEIANLAAIFDMVRMGYGYMVAPLTAVRAHMDDRELCLHRIREPALRCTLSIATPVQTKRDALTLKAITILRDVTERQISSFGKEVEASIDAHRFEAQ